MTSPIKQMFSQPPDAETVVDFVSAARNGNKKNIQNFLSRHPDFIDATDLSGNTALMKAAQGGHGDIVRLLVKSGANINAQNLLGNTPLIMAAGRPHKRLVVFLLLKGANPAHRNGQGHSAMASAIIQGRRDIAEIIRNWDQIQERCLQMKREKKQQRWLAATDFGAGLKKPMRPPRPFNLPKGP